MAPALHRLTPVDPLGAPLTVADSAVTAFDELFVNIDRSIVCTKESCWQIEVLGIHQIQNDWWLQLNLVGREPHMITVRTEHPSVASIRDQVTEWLNHASAAVAVHGPATV